MSTKIEVKTDPWEPHHYVVPVRRPHNICTCTTLDIDYKPGTGIYCKICNRVILGL